MPYFGQQAGDNTATMSKATREQLLDVITIITPTKTPLLSTLPKMRATNRTTEWLTDELGSPGDPANGNTDVQAFSEDTDADFTSEVGPYRIQNRTHIFRETVSASDLLDYVDTVDTDSVYASRLIKKIKLQAMRIEFAAIHSYSQVPVGVGNQESPGTQPGKMIGLEQCARNAGFTASDQDWSTLPDNVRGTQYDLTESPPKHFLETHIGDALELMSDKGAEPTDVWCRVNQKRQIADFEAASTRNINSDDRMLIYTVDVYEGPTGVVIINNHSEVKKSSVFITQTDLMQWAILKPTIPERLARIGSAFKGMVETALTLVYLVPACVLEISGLSETYEKVTETAVEETA
jgi:hypothetical protein